MGMFPKSWVLPCKALSWQLPNQNSIGKSFTKIPWGAGMAQLPGAGMHFQQVGMRINWEYSAWEGLNYILHKAGRGQHPCEAVSGIYVPWHGWDGALGRAGLSSSCQSEKTGRGKTLSNSSIFTAKWGFYSWENEAAPARLLDGISGSSPNIRIMEFGNAAGNFIGCFSASKKYLCK